MGYIKINKLEARKRWNAGERIYLLPCKANPYSIWISPHGSVKSEDAFMDFDKLCNAFSYYNCNAELGKTIAFYIKEEESNAENLPTV